jgi:uncharacterized protein (DUF885 family)
MTPIRASVFLGIGIYCFWLLGGWTADAAPPPVSPESTVLSVPDSTSPDVDAEFPGGILAWARTPVGRLEGEYLRLLVEVAPVRATLLGLHGGDARLGPVGEAGRRETVRRWREFGDKLAAVDARVLDPDDRLDLALMRHEVHWRLFELDTLRSFSRDPSLAVGEVASGLYGLLARDYAPLEVRARALASRLSQVPPYLDGATHLLGNPPRVLVEQGLARTEALSLFLIDDLPATVAGVRDSALADSLSQATSLALEAVWKYRKILTDEVLPRAPESFALGGPLLLATLRASEEVGLSLDSLRTLADGELARLGRRFAATAKQIDSTLTPPQVLRQVSENQPNPGGVLAAVQDALDGARIFVLTDGTVPLDHPPRIEIKASPRSARWANATLAFPGPFEEGDFPGIFYVTMPDAFTPPEEREEVLRFLSRPLLRNLAVHEGYPGHALQAAALQRVLRPARRAIWSTAFVEGWAHYAEELVLERGYRKHDRAFRLVTLQSGLRRAGRFRVALGLHAEGWSLDRAAAFLEEKAMLEPSLARREAERGAVDPLYMVYTLGRLQIESLRGEMMREEGSRFSLERFHRRLLALGAPPLPLARARLLAPEVPGGFYLD